MKVKKSLIRKAFLLIDSYADVTMDWCHGGAKGRWYKEENRRARKVSAELRKLLISANAE